MQARHSCGAGRQVVRCPGGAAAGGGQLLISRAQAARPTACGFKMTLTYSSATRPEFLFALGDESVNVICICWSRPLCGSL
jgi:hypothetical protein